MKKGISLSVTLMILIAMGIIVLIVLFSIVQGSTKPVADIAEQNLLRNCCNKYKPTCSNRGLICSMEDGRSIQEIADDLDVDLNAFCGCA